MRNRYMTYWWPVTVKQSFTDVTILTIVRYINTSSFAFVHLLDLNVREFPDNNNHKGAQSTVVACGSLIIPQVKKGKSIQWRRFGYSVLFSIDFDDLIFGLLLSFCFDWEDISNTRDLFHQLSKHLSARRIFNALVDVWISTKHCLSCLIYYIPH